MSELFCAAPQEKAPFSQVAEPFAQTAGCAFKALTKPVYLSMMKARLNDGLIVLATRVKPERSFEK
ncbi:MAG TPA: hypothetical protein IAB79_03715 [Candidatus Faecousia excrementipullorum]|nr:hypothetical protein [Candidatus Faecousia excrementipullorum]